jgi:hypothetical protein
MRGVTLAKGRVGSGAETNPLPETRHWPVRPEADPANFGRGWIGDFG